MLNLRCENPGSFWLVTCVTDLKSAAIIFHSTYIHLPPSVLHCLLLLSFMLSSFLFSSSTPFPSSNFSTSAGCAAALHQPVTVSGVWRVKAGIHYVTDVLWNAGVPFMHSSTPPPLFNPDWSVLCVRDHRLIAPAWAKLQAHIFSLLSLSFLCLQARGCTLLRCEITPFQHGSHHHIVEVKGRRGVGGWCGLRAEKEHSVPEKCSTGSPLLSTNSPLKGWWDHTVWRFWLASVSVRRWARTSSNGHCLMMIFLLYGRDSRVFPSPKFKYNWKEKDHCK